MKNSKQVLLSILGVLIIIGSTVGITYAFFTYSRVGDLNNSISSGTIVFNFTDGGEQINAIHEYPISDSDASQGASSTQFTVSGLLSNSSSSINYYVKLIPGDVACVGETQPASGTCSENDLEDRTRLPDYAIKIQLTSSDNNSGIRNNYNNNSSSNMGNFLSTTTTNTVTNDGLIIASGTINGVDGSNSTIKHTYTLKLWISEDKVKVGDYEAEEGELVSVYEPSDYENLYYSVKIKVVAADSSETLN